LNLNAVGATLTWGCRFDLRQPAHRYRKAGNKASRKLWNGPVTAWEADEMPTSVSKISAHAANGWHA
jgi:hypothetical protein